MTDVLRPADLREAHQALADTAGPVRIAGAGTAASWAGEPEPARVLDTTALSGILAYNPGDLTVEVLAGTPVSLLDSELATKDQRLAFDAARIRRGATVGGLVATADSGPAALAYGSLRDLVIGVTVVLADGTLARGGGHVIKNVAGYDLAKLLHGSYGTLALLAEVVLRLHPRPKATRTVAVDCDLSGAARHATALLAGAFEPVAVEWADGALLVRLEGTEDGVAARATSVAETLDARVLPAEQADEQWARHAELADPLPGNDSGAVVRIGCRPSRLAPLLARLPASHVTAGPATGIATITVPADKATVARVHAEVTTVGGTSVVRARPDGAELPVWGQTPSAVRILAALKQKLDPGNRFGTGRFAPWL